MEKLWDLMGNNDIWTLILMDFSGWIKKITELNLVRPYFGMIPLINYEKPGFGRTVRSWWNLPDDLWQGVSQISSSHQRRWELSSNQDSECKGFFFIYHWLVCSGLFPTTIGVSSTQIPSTVYHLPLVHHLPKYHPVWLRSFIHLPLVSAACFVYPP
jgi:hypothetical protein